MPQSKANITAGLQYQTSQELTISIIVSAGLSCTFLYINSVLLFTLRSKMVFRETSRFILLYNLLFADTLQLVLNLLLYVLAASRIKLTFYVCGTLIMLSILTTTISPLTLAVMSFERYVAVCYPLRHAAIITIRSTGVSIAVVWAFSFLNIFIRLLLLYSNVKFSLTLQMKDFCSKEALFLAPISYHFDKAYAGILFLSVGVAIICSYMGVMLVARSASTDKASTRKASQTLLLHLTQLGLILTSTLYSTMIIAIARTADRLVVVRLYNVFFVCFSILPRCLNALIYGLRDQTIRPILMYHLCCQWRRSAFLTSE
ncbi:odorant receptor 131-2-like [Centroberyx gerrardi]